MSPVTLKWRGDELRLGGVTVGVVRRSIAAVGHVYESWPDDRVSEPYQSKDDAKQDAERHVRDLLAKAAAL